MQPAKINYKIYQGSTFQETLRWESETKTYVPISAITKDAPCVITTSAHVIPLGWRVRVTNVAGMKEINSVGDDAYYLVTGKTSTTLSLNKVNSLGYTAYTSGGVVEYNTPVPLTGYTALMQIRETLESTTVIHQMTSAAGGGIQINTTDSTIFLTIPAAITTGFSFDSAVYSLELTNSSGVVTPFMAGNLTLVREVTR
jgi:hypothetical protein